MRNSYNKFGRWLGPILNICICITKAGFQEVCKIGSHPFRYSTWHSQALLQQGSNKGHHLHVHAWIHYPTNLKGSWGIHRVPISLDWHLNELPTGQEGRYIGPIHLHIDMCVQKSTTKILEPPVRSLATTRKGRTGHHGAQRSSVCKAKQPCLVVHWTGFGSKCRHGANHVCFFNR